MTQMLQQDDKNFDPVSMVDKTESSNTVNRSLTIFKKGKNPFS
jgi:hypothetical protein